ncbi:MAG: hypothetical protein JWP49_2009 [Phenylobacterium sp.]|nr:hypothetical protein [Phenylobacterium sp.]
MAIPHYQVTCHKKDDANIHTRIQGLGGPGGGGWYRDLDVLIEGIESRQYDLWTKSQEDTSVWVVVAKRNNRKYLKTEADGEEPDNLLALRQCP